MAANTAKKKTTAGARKSGSSGRKTASSGSRSSSGTKRAASSAKTSSVREEQTQKASPFLAREAALWLILALCIIVFISFFGIGGYVGSLISDVCFGVFGVFAYLFPVLVFFAAAFALSNRGSSVALIKVAACVLLFLCLCTAADLIGGPEYGDVYSASQIYAVCASMKQGGGVIGGSVCYALVPAIGTAGTAVLLIVFALICIVLISQRSLLRGVRHQGSRVYQSAKESSERRREEREKREERDRQAVQERADKAEPVKLQTGDSPARHTERLSSVSAGEASFTAGDSFQSLGGTQSAEAEYTRQPKNQKKTQTANPENRQLDVSVMFPSSSSARRTEHRASGVTTDTKIEAEKPRAKADVQELHPPKPAAAPEAAEGANYIDLSQEYPLHIEGVEEEPEEEPYEEPVQKAAAVKAPVAGQDKAAEETAGAEAPAEDGEEQTAAAQSAQGKIRHNPRSSEKEIAEGIASVEAEAEQAAKNVRPEYVYPPLDLLKKGSHKTKKGQEQEIRQTAAKLQQTLDSFGVHVTVTNVSCGPSVTRYELLPEQGVKVSRIVSLADDIKLNLAAADIRIEAPIPGKSAVGIEVPNNDNSTVALRDILESDEFVNHKSRLAFATGKDIAGKVVVSDIAKMPHLLIAGATGSGKSVCINTLIMSILYKASPDEVKLIMIDPKVVELSVYNGIPHLLIPVVTDPKKAAGALNWAVAEMTDRYAKFAEVGARDLAGYNQKVEALQDVDDENKPQKLPQIVIIVDELADLMMVAPGEVEDSICRLAQLARAAGLHLVIATQRPSVNVITGLIKANMPSRIAFAVSSGVDSRTIIDMYGAEKLLGKGDMLFYPQGYQKPARVQGAFVSDEEVADVVDFLKGNNESVSYDAEMEEQIQKAEQAASAAKSADDNDELFAEAGKFIIEKDKASIGMLQRVFKIGFNRAARIMDQLADAGVVGPEEGTKPRRILMNEEQFENYLEEN